MSAANTMAKSQAGTESVPRPAPKTAKLFKNGRSQAVRLPKEFRFEGKEVAIRRDAATGEVVLSQPAAQQTKTLQEWSDLFDSLGFPEGLFKREVDTPGKLTARELFQIVDWAEFPEDFMAGREVHMARKPDFL
ncbi:MAG: AbrB/MazE/SpoVT family DNA-binding domain-containing protein [Terracidiphilus sp.]|jgi:antitoxin VapB